MADLSQVKANIEAALLQNAVGGVRAYTDGSLQVSLEAIKDLLDADERIENMRRRAAHDYASAQVETVM